VEEAVRVGQAARVPVQYSHIAIIDPRAHGRAAELLDVLDRARADDVDVACDVYPYTAAGSGLSQLVPEWLQEGGVPRMLERLRDPVTRARARADTAQGWFGGLPWDWPSIVLASVRSEGNQTLVGRSLAAAAAVRGEEPVETLLALIDEEDNHVTAVMHNRTEADMRTFLAHPLSAIGSDGRAVSPHGLYASARPHPRFYGTYPRVLGPYVRDVGLLSLEAAVHKMTGLPAARLTLQDRGRVAPGLAADLVVLDPATVADRATFEDPHRYPVGIVHVLVNGELLVEAGRHTGRRPGQVLRRRPR
jgi:N-acyl-D-aspartate/D-glutamate deacylase